MNPSNCSNDQYTKSYSEFFQGEEEKKKELTYKEKMRFIKGQKFLSMLEQRKKKFDKTASHPILAGYDPTKAPPKSKFKINMKLDRKNTNVRAIRASVIESGSILEQKPNK